MRLSFTKMHGAGNDFVMVDDRAQRCPVDDRAFVAALAQRPDGIGCEGVIFVRPSAKADFAMRFFNPDGGEADLCGNGARCVAAFALEKGVVLSPSMRFETRSGVLAARVGEDSRVCIEMPNPTEVSEDFACVGVPHAIVSVADVEACDVAGRGREVRFSERFAPAGANVDFVEWQSPHELKIRTYERGVEAESFACGTGATASAVVGVTFHHLAFPVNAHTARGDVLTVDGVFEGGACRDLTLTGPVKTVFHGEIDMKGID